MSASQLALFLLSVGLATYTQTLTGFAFALVLLGLVGILDLVALPLAVDVTTSLTLVNALAMLWRRPPTMGAQVIRPTLTASLSGVCVGLWLLSWLSSSAVNQLKLLLGVTIIVCALILVLRARPYARPSNKISFGFYGGLSGLMSGLFSAGGPPLVFHFYRQPAPAEAIRNTLVLMFAVASTFRLTLVVASGQYDADALKLTLLSLPTVVLVTWLARRFPPSWSVQTIRKLVFVLLLASGAGLAAPVLVTLLR